MKKLDNPLKINIKNFYDNIKESIKIEDNKKTLNKRHKKYYLNQDKKFMTGLAVIGLIILLLFGICYYFLVFAPQMEQLETEKTLKTNEVNELFKDNTTNQAKQAIIAQIDSATSIEEVQSIDVDAMAFPVIKNQLLNQLNEFKDPYNRVEININGTENIMSINNASMHINSSTSKELSEITIKSVDSVIVPLSITRKQAASGLVIEGDVVDIYQNAQQTQESMDQSNTTSNETANDTNNTLSTDLVSQDTSKLVGGAKVVSILRSRDSGSIEYNLELNEYPNSRNLSQTNTIDVEEVLSSKAIGTLDESQLNLFLSEFGNRLSNYERTSNLGDLEVEYIIMVEVPRESVQSVLSNMDNIILTIPTYDAPSWVNLRT